MKRWEGVEREKEREQEVVSTLESLATVGVTEGYV